MKTTPYGEIVFGETDLFNLAMQGHDLCKLENVLTDATIDLDSLTQIGLDHDKFKTWQHEKNQHITVQEFDQICQSQWFMPEEYKNLDIAEHVLGLCNNNAELQRCGQELLLYQERNLFDLLRYLKYLMDVMHAHNLIWGVGRGSSVASYVLYKLGVHKIDSLYYDLDPAEFLR